MSQPRDDERPRSAEVGSAEVGSAEVDEPDFADEHSGVTFADELPDGPERAPADESVPAGLAGADPTET